MGIVLKHRLQRRRAHSGMTLVEILVVLAIIAAIAAIIYPTVIDSFKKSQATMVAQRLDAIQKAKVQYLIDSQTDSSLTAYKDGQAADITALQRYLIRFGQQASQAQLDQGTGGAINLGNWDGAAYYTPTGNENNPYIAQYSIPTSASPTPSSGQ
jgi:prepilin-type N-terminal cleavage/methylation domain-containing protein